MVSMTMSFPKFKWDSITVNEISGDPVSQAVSTLAKLPQALQRPRFMRTTWIHLAFQGPVSPVHNLLPIRISLTLFELKAAFQPLTTEHGEFKALSPQGSSNWCLLAKLKHKSI